MALEGLSIILTFVAKGVPKGGETFLPDEESIPVVVTNFVSEMAEDGAGGLMKLQSALFAFVVIRLGNVDGYYPEFMACQHRLIRQVGEKFVTHTSLGIVGLARHRESETKQALVQAVGRLEPGPSHFVSGDAEIRKGTCQAARDAIGIGIVARDRPVADVVDGEFWQSR
jgi:hypothetical protein